VTRETEHAKEDREETKLQYKLASFALCERKWWGSKTERGVGAGLGKKILLRVWFRSWPPVSGIA